MAFIRGSIKFPPNTDKIIVKKMLVKIEILKSWNGTAGKQRKGPKIARTSFEFTNLNTGLSSM